MTLTPEIRPLTQEDLPGVKEFTDVAIGTDYYSLEELDDIYRRSIAPNQRMCSLVLADPKTRQIYGVRITYPPGNWSKGKGAGVRSELWKAPLAQTGYFQSLFLAHEFQGQGWGQKLSISSMEILKEVGASAVVCHSWKESPHDSSGKYLRKLGFELVATHPFYWREVDYVCTRCGKPCLCTAEEMICYLA